MEKKGINLDPFPEIRAAYLGREKGLSFRAGDRKDVLRWQRETKKKLAGVLGDFPQTASPLRPEVLEKRDFPGYTRETVTFNSRGKMRVFAYFLLPRKRRLPLPAVICLPGHGRGVDEIVGISEDGKMRGRPGGYMQDFALQAVRKGFAVLAVEPIGFGHRRENAAVRKGPNASSCNPFSGALLLLGGTIAGWRVYDVVRSVDYLETRKEVIRDRIGLMGISGGGTVSIYAAALEERIKATVLSGSFCTFYRSIFSVVHCIDNFVPDVLSCGEMYDVAGLIAPRALFIEAGDKDPIFPVEGVREAFGKVGEVYRALGAESRLDWKILRGGHRIYGKNAFEFLSRILG